MKKFILTITFLLIANQISIVAFAYVAGPCTSNLECGDAEFCTNGKCVELVPRLGEGNTDISEKYKETTQVGQLPELTLESAFTSIIKTVLTWTTIFIISALVVAGFYYLKSRGQEEDITKAKNIIIYILIGVTIMAAAYGIITGISQFNFFK